MKKLISVLVIAVIGALIFIIHPNKEDVTASNDKEARANRIASVLESAWDKFGLFSFQIGDTDPTIWIGMDETKSEQELRDYLNENIDKYDLIYYNVEVFKKSQQELEIEHAMSLIENTVFNYIKEKNYTDVQVHYPSIEPKPVLKISISKDSERSSEDLKTELESLVASKTNELQIKGISYEIQVFKS
ncbi:hypothetical protein [Cytobacillus massiliigabonensis]|uniref:hypothetical protein n=1 Tax=Cytobacillus massiliigabonensis TaxID=1871011 RepID=UPI000C8259BA|nr:hypothetical protein [Cytobacillus massiliigabonensis]